MGNEAVAEHRLEMGIFGAVRQGTIIKMEQYVGVFYAKQ